MELQNLATAHKLYFYGNRYRRAFYIESTIKELSLTATEDGIIQATVSVKDLLFNLLAIFEYQIQTEEDMAIFMHLLAE